VPFFEPVPDGPGRFALFFAPLDPRPDTALPRGASDFAPLPFGVRDRAPVSLKVSLVGAPRFEARVYRRCVARAICFSSGELPGKLCSTHLPLRYG
jgi:hypothetical protein